MLYSTHTHIHTHIHTYTHVRSGVVPCRKRAGILIYRSPQNVEVHHPWLSKVTFTCLDGLCYEMLSIQRWS